MSAQPTELLPVYLAVGDDRLMRDTVVDRIKARVAELGDLDFNSETIDGGSATGTQIVDAANTFPFASEKRLVIVNDVEKLSKADQDIVVEYLQAPTRSTVLMLLANKLPSNTKLHGAVKAVDPKAVINAEQKKKASDVRDRVIAIAASKGLTLSSSDASHLIERSGKSTVRLSAELQKIASFVGQRTVITREDIDQIVVPTREIAPWELTDAVSARDLATVVELTGTMLDDGRTPIELLSTVIRRIRDLITIRALLDRDENSSAIAAALGQPEWKVRSLIGWTRGWEAAELRDSLVTASQADADMKSGADPVVTLELWLFATVAGGSLQAR